ncbi:MAG TPA: endonuclease/exonuclease/phosphatase family protein [Mobilitalea sp.]|nr:endonuclease/exonuclease/phosphatase family protein [Mobilitalea sp.]
MKLVTFNIRCDYDQDGENSFRYRKALILDKLNKEDPDIICFQEVLPHVARWLRENLQEYYVIGCGRDEKLEDEMTAIAYKKMLFNLIGLDIFWLSETPKVIASRYPDQSICPRICTVALLQNLETKECFRIYNTHLDHIGEEARRLSLLQILDRMEKEDNFINASAILTGDFNAFPDSPEMEVFQRYPDYIDLTAGVGGTFHDFGQLAETEKIDYIFTEKMFKCSCVSIWENCTNGIYLSDHYPVSVEIFTK